jgi:hypothetical protein
MIPNTLISTKILLDGYTELRERLNGKCGGSCPIRCVSYMQVPKRISKYCMFSYVNDNYTTKRIDLFCSFCERCWNIDEDDCPCNSHLLQKEVFLRLDEVIDELQTKLNKEFSS